MPDAKGDSGLREWVLLHYQIPATPSASRVHIWRKLKSLGAQLLHDSVWVLPATPWAIEQFQWLASEVHEASGDAMVWQAALTMSGQNANLVDRFREASEREYRPLWEDLLAPSPDLENIARRFQQVRRRDYFESSLGKQVYQVLRTRRGE